jgi:hypothetical protein
MLFGWKPIIASKKGPVPLKFDYDDLPVGKNSVTGEEYPTVYNGPRPGDSIKMHKELSGNNSYKFPLNPSIMHSYHSV